MLLLLSETPAVSVIIIGYFGLPPGRTGELIKTEFFDMWAGGEFVFFCSRDVGFYIRTLL